ncbi:PREDICTED: probable myosin-binding protein 4 isoform X2 [Ipomoea nil]|uniref:probable myosin-binding protein 4 isoform X2 n=1 Tax=Ipomoea nil TaxID=35883 RepID=UPI000900DF81|nr:PREDICTED: probable myosin-binding protein 4 isoform X2 [Ipomoea nil]
MAAAGISSARQRNPRGYMALLSSAACEWFLMFLLFVDAALSYLLTKFARYCELQTPCLLCSRLDHVFGNKKPGYYQSLLCSNHREEISSLVHCYIHGNLADVRGMCEECFVSLAAENRLTMNKSWMDMYMKKNPLASSSGPWRCSCCNKSWKARSSAQKLVQLTPVGCGASTASVKPHLPRTPDHSWFNRQDSFKKIRDQLSGPKSPCSPGKIGVDRLSNVGYTELKFSSDSESEVASDDEDGYYGLCGTNYSNSRNGGHPAKMFVQKSSTHGVALGKTRRQSAEPDQFDLDQSMQLNANKDSVLISHIKHGLGERDWEPFSPKPHSPIMPKVMPLDDTPQLSGVSEVPYASREISKPNISHFHMSGPSLLSDLTNLPSSPTTVKIPEVNMTDSNHKGHNSVINDTTVTTGNSDDRASVTPNHMNLVDASAMSYRDGEIYHMPAEQSGSSSGSPRMAEDAKSLLQTSAPEMDFLKNRRAYGHHDDIQRSDGSSFDGKHVLQKTTSLEKSECGSECMDVFILSDIEDESMVDRLKRQVEHDQKALKNLYKELEEERNAAASAANEAMAMITRLQEEKATLHMEASQHLRMMEEQAEYDMEALERANDMLAEKDKETQDLEAQLEQYRKMYREGSVVSDLQKDEIGSKGIVENHSVAQVENNRIQFCDLKADKKSSVLNFKNEKIYTSP